MPLIAIISSSVRDGRNSHRVTLFFEKFLNDRKYGTIDVLDLKTYNFPLFKERLRYLKKPPEKINEFAGRISKADGILIITPEYNGGYPAALKNVIDLLYDEWKRKPIAIATVSDGSFGGTQVITSLQFTLWKIGAWIVPAMFPVPKVSESFDVKGVPADPEAINKRAVKFADELKWCMEAAAKMKQQ